MIKIPGQPGAFKQVGNSDVLGNIWSSFDLDLTENVGRMRVAPRGMIVTKDNDASVTGMTTPVAFRMYATGAGTQKIWSIAGKMMYNAGNPNDAFITDVTANTPAVGDGSDMELFNGALYVVGTGKIMKYNGSTWAEIETGLGSFTTSCCVFQGRFYYTRNSSAISSINLLDTNVNASGNPNNIRYAVQLADFGAGGSNANTITSIRAASNRIWIATIDKTSQNYSAGRAGKVFEWDGQSTQANKVYYLNSIGALALIIKGDIPYVLDADGKLLAFNGREFTEIAQLPVPQNKYLKNPTNTVTQQFIHPRGITLKNDKIIMLINNEVQASGFPILENLPSGVWEYDSSIGLYHKYSISQWQTGVTTTRTDFAQNRIAESGALFSAKSTNNSSSLNGDLLMGVKYYTDATNTKFGIFINDTKQSTQKVGYFVMTKIDSQNVQDTWIKVYAIHKKLLDASDRIVLKYRLDDIEPVEATITWTSTTSFTTTTDISTYSIGDEVEITQGTGGGQIEHITGIVNTSGTYTVTFTNAFIGATGTAKARFQKWTLIPTEQTNQALRIKEFSIGKSSSSIQLKCVMYFKGPDELNYLQIINKEHQPSV